MTIINNKHFFFSNGGRSVEIKQLRLKRPLEAVLRGSEKVDGKYVKNNEDERNDRKRKKEEKEERNDEIK